MDPAVTKPNVYIIAGPNGVGKTTFAREFLPQYAEFRNFINADLIAQGLSPFSPEEVAYKAGKLVLREIAGYMERGDDFAFETTLSGRTYLRLLQKLKVAGYGIHIVFLWLPSPELARSRIRERVAMGGRSVPQGDALRRYHRSTANFFQHYSQFADSWMLLNNVEGSPTLIARKDSAGLLIMDRDLFASLSAKYGRAKTA